MQDQKIKNAFGKIREDMDYLRTQVNQLSQKVQQQEKAFELQEDIKQELDKFKQIDLAGFVKNMEQELNRSSQYISEMHQRSSHINQVIEKFTSQMEQYTVKFEDLKKKFQDLQYEVQNNRLDVKVLKDQYNAISSIVDEKVEDKRDSMKLDLDGRLASFEKSLERYEKHQKEREEEHARQIQQLFEMMQEKIDMEISSLRMEMLENLGKEPKKTPSSRKSVPKPSKEASSAPTETKDPKQASNSSLKTGKVKSEAAKKTNKKEDNQTTSEKDKGDHRLKRVVKWLFVDEDEDEDLNEVKQASKQEKLKK